MARKPHRSAVINDRVVHTSGKIPVLLTRHFSTSLILRMIRRQVQNIYLHRKEAGSSRRIVYTIRELIGEGLYEKGQRDKQWGTGRIVNLARWWLDDRGVVTFFFFSISLPVTKENHFPCSLVSFSSFFRLSIAFQYPDSLNKVPFFLSFSSLPLLFLSSPLSTMTSPCLVKVRKKRHERKRREWVLVKPFIKQV